MDASLSADAFLHKFKFYRENKLSESSNFSGIHLSSMEERNPKRTAALLNESLMISLTLYIPSRT